MDALIETALPLSVRSQFSAAIAALYMCLDVLHEDSPAAREARKAIKQLQEFMRL